MGLLFEGGVDGKKPLTYNKKTETKSTDYLYDLKQSEVRDYLDKQLLGVDLKCDLEPVRIVFKVRIRGQAFD